MNKEDAKKWLEYHHAGIKPKRVKFRGLVYSDMALSKQESFDLNGCRLIIGPIPKSTSPAFFGGYSPALMCEAIYEGGDRHGGSNSDLDYAVSKVLPLLGFDYRLASEYEQFEEYEDGWLQVISPSIQASIQSIHQELPNKRIHEIVEAYEKLSKRSDKRAKKAVLMRNRLKEAVMLQSISRRYSFLSFYEILELISVDLCSEAECPSGDLVAHEMATFSLSSKGSQRAKIYFLLRAINNDFDVAKCMGLPDVRNSIAHGEFSVPYEELELCRQLAFWASESFALLLVQKQGNPLQVQRP